MFFLLSHSNAFREKKGSRSTMHYWEEEDAPSHIVIGKCGDLLIIARILYRVWHCTNSLRTCEHNIPDILPNILARKRRMRLWSNAHIPSTRRNTVHRNRVTDRPNGPLRDFRPYSTSPHNHHKITSNFDNTLRGNKHNPIRNQRVCRWHTFFPPPEFFPSVTRTLRHAASFSCGFLSIFGFIIITRVMITTSGCLLFTHTHAREQT